VAVETATAPINANVISPIQSASSGRKPFTSYQATGLCPAGHRRNPRTPLISGRKSP
jgi:hypothetical protein